MDPFKKFYLQASFPSILVPTILIIIASVLTFLMLLVAFYVATYAQILGILDRFPPLALTASSIIFGFIIIGLTQSLNNLSTINFRELEVANNIILLKKNVEKDDALRNKNICYRMQDLIFGKADIICKGKASEIIDAAYLYYSSPEIRHAKSSNVRIMFYFHFIPLIYLIISITTSIISLIPTNNADLIFSQVFCLWLSLSTVLGAIPIALVTFIFSIMMLNRMGDESIDIISQINLQIYGTEDDAEVCRQYCMRPSRFSKPILFDLSELFDISESDVPQSKQNSSRETSS